MGSTNIRQQWFREFWEQCVAVPSQLVEARHIQGRYCPHDRIHGLNVNHVGAWLILTSVAIIRSPPPPEIGDGPFVAMVSSLFHDRRSVRRDKWQLLVSVPRAPLPPALGSDMAKPTRASWRDQPAGIE